MHGMYVDARLIIDFFLDLDGFDDWWDGMERETKHEILENLQSFLDND